MKCHCGAEITRPGQRHCHRCHATAQREYRARVALERAQGQAALALLRRLDIHLAQGKEIQRVEFTRQFSGADLCAWRKQMKLTQKEFAEDFGYTSGRISKMETGQAKVARPLVAAYLRHVKQAQLALILFNNSDEKAVNLSAVKDCTE